MIAASKGYNLTVVMPDSMSLERRVILKALGANLVLTPGSKGFQAAFDKVEEISQKENYYKTNQLSSADNPKCHR